jgi:CRP-like cAMP-binding protein
MEEKTQKLIQKDEPIIRSYERMRYIYVIAKGEVNEEWKLPDNSFKKRTIKAHDFVGLSELCIAHTEDIDYSATATSVVCLYGFPIQKFKDYLSKNSRFEAELNK